MALLCEGGVSEVGRASSPPPRTSSSHAHAEALPPFPLPALSWVPGPPGFLPALGRVRKGSAQAIGEQGPLSQTLRKAPPLVPLFP